MTTTIERPTFHRRWQVEEDDYLREHYQSMQAIADALGRTRDAVQVRARVLGVARRITEIEWSADEITFLTEHYNTMTAQEIANALGRTLRAVRNKALGIKVSSPRHSVDFQKMPYFRVICELMEQCAGLNGSCSSCRLSDDCHRLWRSYMAPSNGLSYDVPEDKFPQALDEFAELFSTRCEILRIHTEEEQALRSRMREADGLVIFRCED